MLFLIILITVVRYSLVELVTGYFIKLAYDININILRIVINLIMVLGVKFHQKGLFDKEYIHTVCKYHYELLFKSVESLV